VYPVAFRSASWNHLDLGLARIDKRLILKEDRKCTTEVKIQDKSRFYADSEFVVSS
jgi:hypothetical protein